MKRPTKPQRRRVTKRFPCTVGGLLQVLEQDADFEIEIYGGEFELTRGASDREYQEALQKYEADLLEYKKRRLEKLKRELGDDT